MHSVHVVVGLLPMQDQINLEFILNLTWAYIKLIRFVNSDRPLENSPEVLCTD